MKKYEEPKLKLHQLKTGKLMELSGANTNISNPGSEGAKNGINDFDEVDAWGSN